jgi:hypothetical protein
MQGFAFPEELIVETIACFLDEDGVVLSEEEAVSALRNLGGLFLAFATGENERGSGQRLSAGGAPRSTGARNTGGTLPNAT